MGRALDLVSASATAAAAGGTAGAAVSGDSLTVRNGRPGSRVRLVAAWGNQQTGTAIQITHPSGHDVTRDLRWATPLDGVTQFIPLGFPEVLQPQEVLATTFFGTGVAGDIDNLSMLIAYDDLPGVEGRFIGVEELGMMVEKLVTVQLTITTGAGGGYTGSEAINAESDLLLANRDYALLGANVAIQCTSVRVVGADFGNLGVGIPGDNLGPYYTVDWFVRLSEALGEAWIPVFNSANRSGVLVSALQDENAAAVRLSLNLALLR
jgi:hypothetical protein